MTQVSPGDANPYAADAASTVWVEEVSWLDRIPRSVARAAIFVIFVCIWQLVYLSGLVSPIILPSPLETEQQLYSVGHNLVTGDSMLGPLWITLKEVFYVFILSTVIGITRAVRIGGASCGEKG